MSQRGRGRKTVTPLLYAYVVLPSLFYNVLLYGVTNVTRLNINCTEDLDADITEHFHQLTFDKAQVAQS